MYTRTNRTKEWFDSLGSNYIPADNATQNLRRGVIRDDERQRIKQQRALELQEQQRLEKEYEKVQSVSRSDQG